MRTLLVLGTAMVACGCAATATPLASAPDAIPASAIGFTTAERPITEPREVPFTADDPRATLLRLDYVGRVGTSHRRGRIVGLEPAYRLEPVCSAPCGAAIAPATWYVVGGDGVARTEAFQLPGDATSIRVRTGGSQTAREIGIAATFAGAVVAILGGAGLGLHDTSGVSTGMLVTGGAAVLVGLPLWILNRPTEVEFAP